MGQKKYNFKVAVVHWPIGGDKNVILERYVRATCRSDAIRKVACLKSVRQAVRNRPPFFRYRVYRKTKKGLQKM